MELHVFLGPRGFYSMINILVVIKIYPFSYARNPEFLLWIGITLIKILFDVFRVFIQRDGEWNIEEDEHTRQSEVEKPRCYMTLINRKISRYYGARCTKATNNVCVLIDHVFQRCIKQFLELFNLLRFSSPPGFQEIAGTWTSRAVSSCGVTRHTKFLRGTRDNFRDPEHLYTILICSWSKLVYWKI